VRRFIVTAPTRTGTPQDFAARFPELTRDSAATYEAVDQVEIRDFTIKQKRVAFRIDNDIFEASAILGLPVMQDMVKMSKGIGDIAEREDGDYTEIFSIFDQVLLPDSARRFRERAMSRGDEGIDVKRQLLPILHHLLEVFGLRPTQQSSDSSTGSPSGDDGITSTAGALPSGSSLAT
jgi:hypothetical protein